MTPVTAVVPVKRLAAAKSRLDLPVARRRALALAFAVDTVAALAASPLVRDRLVLLGQRGHRTPGVGAHPASLAPPVPHRGTERRRVDQRHLVSAVTAGDHTAGRTPHHRRLGLDRHHEPAANVPLDTGHVQPVHADDQVAPVAVAAGRRPAHRRVIHVEVLEIR